MKMPKGFVAGGIGFLIWGYIEPILEGAFGETLGSIAGSSTTMLFAFISGGLFVSYVLPMVQKYTPKL